MGISKKLAVTLSIGISVFPEDGQDVSTFIKNADLALYDVKAGGRNNYKFYSGRHSKEKFLIGTLNKSEIKACIITLAIANVKKAMHVTVIFAKCQT